MAGGEGIKTPSETEAETISRIWAWFLGFSLFLLMFCKLWVVAQAPKSVRASLSQALTRELVLLVAPVGGSSSFQLIPPVLRALL